MGACATIGFLLAKTLDQTEYAENPNPESSTNAARTLTKMPGVTAGRDTGFGDASVAPPAILRPVNPQNSSPTHSARPRAGHRAAVEVPSCVGMSATASTPDSAIGPAAISPGNNAAPRGGITSSQSRLGDLPRATDTARRTMTRMTMLTTGSRSEET